MPPEDLLLESRKRTKQQIGKKLIEMNEQINAIDALAQNMEEDFKSSRMVCINFLTNNEIMHLHLS